MSAVHLSVEGLGLGFGFSDSLFRLMFAVACVRGSDFSFQELWLRCGGCSRKP